MCMSTTEPHSEVEPSVENNGPVTNNNNNSESIIKAKDNRRRRRSLSSLDNNTNHDYHYQQQQRDQLPTQSQIPQQQRKSRRSKRTKVSNILEATKEKARFLLAKHLGSTNEEEVTQSLMEVSNLNPNKAEDGDHHIATSSFLTGEWTAETCPNFPGKVKPQEGKEHIVQYTLGRLSFNIFQPSKLVCTLHSTRNQILPMTTSSESSTEASSSSDNSSSSSQKQTYLVFCDITIHTEKGDLRATLRNEGFCYPNKDHPNRLMVCFTGGSLLPTNEVVNDPHTLHLWMETFAGAYQKAQEERTIVSKAFQSVLSWALGLTLPTDIEKSNALCQKHSFHFQMKRSPTGYVDVLYLDDDMRITKGNKGTLVVCRRT